MPHIGNFPERGYPKPLSIPPSVFMPEEDTFDYHCTEYDLRNSTTLTIQEFYAPVYLPHKATVTKLTLYGHRMTAESVLILGLWRANRTGQLFAMTAVMADWTDGDGSKSKTTITDPVIDNVNCTYSLRLSIDPDAIVSDCSFLCGAIEWR